MVARRVGLARLLLALRGRLGRKVDEDEAEDKEANEAKSEPERLCLVFRSLSEVVEKGEVNEWMLDLRASRHVSNDEVGGGLPDDARRPKPSFRKDLLSSVRLNFFGPARQGDGRRGVVVLCPSLVPALCLVSRPSLVAALCLVSARGNRSSGPSSAGGVVALSLSSSRSSSSWVCGPPKKPPCSSIAACFSAAGVCGSIRCVCARPRLTPTRDCASAGAIALVSGPSSSDDVAASLMIELYCISANARGRRSADMVVHFIHT